MEKSIDFDLVADLYDAYVQTDADIGFYLSLCEGHTDILELMCGTGRVSLPLLRARHKLTCVDYSVRMLDVFRGKLTGPESAELICQDISDLRLSRQFEFAFIPFHSIAEITDKANRQRAIRRVYEHLLPGGQFFVSLYNPAYRIGLADGVERPLGGFVTPDGHTLHVRYRNEYVPSEELIQGEQVYEVYDQLGGKLEKRTLPIRFSVVTKEEMLSAAASAGFVLKEMYGDYARGPYLPDSVFMHFLFEKTT